MNRFGDYNGWLVGLAGWCAEVVAAAEPGFTALMMVEAPALPV
jgi:hypothetical protein